ncbi:MAG TPA: hypothetical protein VF942_06810 [Acidimicrobiales bacterium]
MIAGSPFVKLRKEARLTILPITWGEKYPRIYIMRWIVVGTIVAVLTGNAQIGKLNPFGKGGRAGAQSAMGQTIVSVVTYPLPLTIALTRLAGKEANHICTVLKINCDLNPGRNLHYKLRSPFVKNTALPKVSTARAP